MKNLGFILLTAALLAACGRDSGTKNGSVSEATTANGTINGGGGVGIQCGDRVELLDIYEARQAGLTLLETPKTEEEAIDLVSTRIGQHYWNHDSIPVDEQIAVMKRLIVAPIFKLLPIYNAGKNKEEKVEYVESLPLSNDFGKYSIPKECSLIQVAYFSDLETKLSIAKPVWAKLDFLSKSALAMHELMYLVYRRTNIESLKLNANVTTSQNSREFVGKMMSTTPPPVKSLGVLAKENTYMCVSEGEKQETYFYSFTNPTGKLSVVFNVIYDKSHLYQMRADFKKFTLEKLKDPKSMLTEKVPLVLTGFGKDSGFEIVLIKNQDTLNFMLQSKDKRQAPQSCRVY